MPAAKHTNDENARPKKKFQTLNKEQAQKLLEDARGHPLEPLLIVAVLTGLILGECIALSWQDINIHKHTLQVQRSARWVTKQGWVVAEPKTPASRRTLALSPLLISVLNLHRINQDAISQEAGKTWTEQDLVFCNQWGGYITRGTVATSLRSIASKANLTPLRFSNLRNSTTALLLYLDVHPAIIQLLLGHTALPGFQNPHLSPQTVLTLQREAMHKLSNLFQTGDTNENNGAKGGE